MKKTSILLAALAATVAIFAPSALFAATVELTVDSDTTLSAALAAAGQTLSDGDTLVKKGLGKLTSDIVFADGFKLAVTNQEGVLEITAPGQLGCTNQITVVDGATLLLTVPKAEDSNNPPVMLKNRTIQLSGTGATGYKGATSRKVVIPPGRWLGDDGTEVEGPAEITVNAPLSRIPHFKRINKGGKQ
jgi:hypothetical protein